MLLSKSIIKKEICPYLNFGKINKNSKVIDYQVVTSSLYRLKTGCQWRQLPRKQFFREKYSWQNVWNSILKKHKHLLDLSSIQLDGTHTPAKRSGESVAYQGRKKTNTLIMTDSQGIPLVWCHPIAGNNNDAFKASLITFDTNYLHWKGLILLAFSTLILRSKIISSKKIFLDKLYRPGSVARVFLCPLTKKSCK